MKFWFMYISNFVQKKGPLSLLSFSQMARFQKTSTISLTFNHVLILNPLKPHNSNNFGGLLNIFCHLPNLHSPKRKSIYILDMSLCIKLGGF